MMLRIAKRLMPLLAAIMMLNLAGPSLCAQSPAEAQPTIDSVTSDQVVAQVLARNDRLAAANFMLESARRKIGPAGAWDDPMLMLGLQNVPTSGSLTADPMTMKMIGLSWNIPYTGAKGQAKRAAAADTAVSAADRNLEVLMLASTARIAYADIYYRSKALEALSAQYELMTQVVASVQAKVTANQAGQEDLLSAQAELWRLQSDLLMAEADRDKSVFELNALRGAPGDRLMFTMSPPPTDSISLDPDMWLEKAKSVYPPLKKLAAQADAYAFSRDAARRMRWPMFGLSGYYGFRSGQDTGEHGLPGANRLNMVGVQGTFSLPLFSGHQQSSMAASMDAMRLSSSAEYRQVERETETQVRTLHLYALHGAQSISLYETRIIPASEDAFQGALAGYRTDRVPLTTVLNYAIAFYRNRLTLFDLQNQYARTLAELSQYTTDPNDLRGKTEVTSGH